MVGGDAIVVVSSHVLFLISLSSLPNTTIKDNDFAYYHRQTPAFKVLAIQCSTLLLSYVVL